MKPSASVLVSLALLTLICSATLAEQHRVERNGTIFYTYTVSPDEVGLYWLNVTGKPFRQFSALQADLRSHNKRIRFIMNGGLFEEDGSPCGLLVIDGKTLRPLNMKDGVGNFYLKPSGVFYIDSTGAHVISSSEYAAKSPSARLAIQSGPLLLRSGQTHPAFRKESKNRLHRNGVGVRKDGRVVFAITEFDQPERVTLYEFSELYRSLGCDNALFLDGDLSQMFVDPKGDITPGNYFGTIFAVIADQK